MFDVLVIGGGHAGAEAACASARRGARTAIITFARGDIGQMSCNPSIGGVGKGHLVREIDALGGIMAVAGDMAAIHRRMLNASKGSAVRGPRVQADRRLFQAAVYGLVMAHGVDIIEGEVVELRFAAGRVAGVELSDGSLIDAASVVLTTGTFLCAELFRGEERWRGGRANGKAASALGRQVADLGLAEGRLKTGTPPRLDGRTIDWSKLAPQASDHDEWKLSMAVPAIETLPQLSCAITRTTERTHEVIRGGLGRSPLFSGTIEGRGPRYCPSIEDKIVRFGDRDGHQIFLEPEGLQDHLVYPNGISTSLPADVQEAFVRTISGLERAKLATPGYAVEYQFADPRLLGPTLQHRSVEGLFFAGQINGTTGYEEAGAQGLAAGSNAAAFAKDLAPAVFDRSTSYLGVMIDDLTVQGVSEPYRMLTARSEYRLYLRSDNAVSRLGPQAIELGLSRGDHRRAIERHLDRKEHAAKVLRDTNATGPEVGLPDDPARRTLAEWARRPEASSVLLGAVGRHPAALEAIDDAAYAPYLERQRAEEVARQASRAISFPSAFDFAQVHGLSNEMRERLEAARPANLDQASRVAGVTPAALAAIHFALKRYAA